MNDKEKEKMVETNPAQAVGTMIFKKGLEVGMSTMRSMLKHMLEEDEIWDRLIEKTTNEFDIEI